MARSIQEMYEKFKRLLADDGLFYGFIIILVACSSFGLGRWSVATEGGGAPQTAAIVMSERPLASTTGRTIEEKTESTATSVKESGAYVASRKGTKYHLPSCPGASQIKAENKIYFDSKEEAEAAGYTPASNCKGI